METGTIDELILEPHLLTMEDGTMVDVVMKVDLRIPGCSIGVTKILQQKVFTDCNIRDTHQLVTIFRVRKESIGGKLWLMQTEQTVVASHEVPDAKHFARIIETCAGIGAVDVGYENAGATIVASNEANPKFAEIMKSKGFEVGVGDNSHPQTASKLAKHGTCIISGGVSCQPFSRLGDVKEGQDVRAKSLTGALNMIHLLQSPAGILECTPGAMQSEWFQSQLSQFCKQTGYEIHQQILELHHCWPAKRNRWWGIVSMPQLEVKDIPPMPTLEFDPTYFHLFPKLKPMTEFEAKELALDLYELGKFNSQPKGIKASTVDYYKALPTATHSWGSQLTPCACGCRQSGFRDERIAAKGLYGQLVPTEGMSGAVTHRFNNMRHLHAQEVALANGLLPSHIRSDAGVQRLLLAAVGQLASPLQSLWVYSNMVSTNGNGFPIQDICPSKLMAKYANKLFIERDQLLGITPDEHNQYMRVFQEAWKKVGEPAQEETKVVASEAAIVCNQAEAPKCHQPTEEPSFVTSAEASVRNQANAVEGQKQTEIPTVARTGKGKGIGSVQTTPRNNIQPSQDALADEHLLTAVKKCEEQISKLSDTESFQRGGVPGFAVQSRPTHDMIKADTCESKSMADKHTKTPEAHQTNLQTECPHTNQKAEEEIAEHKKDKRTDVQCEIVIPTAKKLRITVPEETKVHQIVEAEVQLGTMSQPITITDTMGMVVHPQTVVSNHQHLVLHSGGLSPIRCPKESSGKVPVFQQATREELLWQQEGCTAFDEMEFYASFVDQIKPNHVHPCVSLPDNPTRALEFGNLVCSMLKPSAHLQAAVTVCILADHHWTPVSVAVVQNVKYVVTTPMQLHWIRRLCEDSIGDSDIQFVSKAIPSTFHADCGFQAIGWMIEAVMNTDMQTPITPSQAHSWRELFHEQLIKDGSHKQWIGAPLTIGGMQSIQNQLQQLVEQHGVAISRSEQCTEELINALGVSTITNVLKSPRPWADLKSRANLHRPPIRVVLASELQDAVKARASKGPIGDKKTKSKQKQPNDILQMKASQITIPHAVFKQEDGREISQIQPMQIHGKCSGVIVMNATEALPYLQVSQQVSQEGVALLIIDHDDVRLPDNKQIIRIPAQCTATQEPIILTVAIFQIGKQVVTRNLPKQCNEIEEVANQVIRVLVFRDQHQAEWSDFVKGPVKALMTQSPFNEIPAEAFLDVWDRQFVTHRMQREAPAESKVFMVNIRIVKEHLPAIMSTSGTAGIFVEPRSNNGRQPDERYQVIWLPRKTFSEASVAKQMTTVDAVLVRYGDKYGLRVSNEHAEQVHGEHRPDLQYLDGTSLKKYKVGPLPYGSTKQSIVNAFAKWGWAARPLGPQGQSSDRAGTMWLVQATTDPSHWVFQMHHGDVLISPETAVVSSAVKSSIIASQKTLQCLKDATKQNDNKKEGQDPWIHRDPWSQPTTKELSVGQVASMQAHLEATIDKKLRESMPASADCEMTDASDSRIVQLEQQVQQLKGNFQHFEQRQTAHNQSIYSQVQQMDQKMQDQHVTINRMLDSKLADQMQKIEALLTKRNRTE